MTWVIVPAACALLALIAIFLRSSLLTLRESVQCSWASLDSLLLERHDLVADLLVSCARHMRYESDALDRVSRADAAAFAAAARSDIPALASAEQALRSSLAALLAQAENYPLLREEAGFRAATERMPEIGAAVDERREFYNSAVNLLNVRSQAFPHSLIARSLGFRSEALFE